jgi:hypothetical protein
MLSTSKQLAKERNFKTDHTTNSKLAIMTKISEQEIDLTCISCNDGQPTLISITKAKKELSR